MHIRYLYYNKVYYLLFNEQEIEIKNKTFSHKIRDQKNG